MDLASLTTGNVHVGPDNPRGKGIADGSPCTRFQSFTRSVTSHSRGTSKMYNTVAWANNNDVN